MNKYLLREIEGASQIPSEKLEEIGQGSESVLVQMRNEGKNIEQEQAMWLAIMSSVFIIQTQRRW